MNKGFQVGWWLIAITVVIMYAGVMLVGEQNTYLASAIGELFILIPIVIGIIYAKKHKSTVNQTLALKKFSPKLLVGACFLIIGAQYFITYTTLYLQSILMILFGIETATSQLVIPDSIPDMLVMVISICFVAPVVEEFLCRGVLIKLFERYGFAASLISSSFAFAFLHFDGRSFIQIFFLGLLLGVFRLCTGSVWITVIMHALNNGLGVLQLILLNSGKYDAFLNVMTVCLLLLGVLFPFIMYMMFTRGVKYFPPINISFEKKRTGFSLAALIMGILFVAVNVVVVLLRFANGDIFADFNMLIG